MTVGILFFVFVAVFVMSLIAVAINMGTILSGKRALDSVVGIHLLGGIAAVISGVGALITGVMWLVQTFTA